MKKNVEISSNSSIIELKAELMKKKEEYEESKRNKQNKPASKSGSKSTSKPERDLKSNSYSKTTSALEEDQLKKSREALEAKSRLYSRLERGKMMENELSAGQRENLMVDFAWKGWNPETEDFDFLAVDSENSEGSQDESDVIGKGPLSMTQVFDLLKTASRSRDQEWIEYEDEFGRTRVSKLIDLRQIQEEREEVNQTLLSETKHYDGDAEIRNKGVAFYQFARNESERQRQMRELKKLREETMEKRMRNLILREERRLKIESRLNRLKERRNKKRKELEENSKLV